MLKKIYDIVTTGNYYNLEKAAQHNMEMIKASIKANELPKIEEEFVKNNHVGCCLHYGLYLLKLMHENGFQVYMAMTKEENPYTHKKTDNHASVCYIKNGQKMIADPVRTIKDGIEDCFDIPIEEFYKQEGPIYLYDIYGEYGNELFFGEFINHPIEIIDGNKFNNRSSY